MLSMSWQKTRSPIVSLALLVIQFSCSCIQASQQLTPAHLLAELPLSNSENLDVFKVLISLLQRGHHGTAVTPDNIVAFWQQRAEELTSQTNTLLTPSSSSSSSSDDTIKSTKSNNSSSVLARLRFISFPPAGSKPQNVVNMTMFQMIAYMQTALVRHCNYSLYHTHQQLLQLQPPVTAVIGQAGSSVTACGCLYSAVLGAPLLALNGNTQIDRPLTVPQFGSDQTPDDLKRPWGMAKNTLHWLAVRGMRAMISYKPWLPLWQTYAPNTGVTRAYQIPATCHIPAYIRLLSAELEYPGQVHAGDVLVGYASTQFPQFPLTPPKADAFVSGASPPVYKGVVVVAFGSTGVYTTRLTPEDYCQMAKAWRLLNRRCYRVLWVLRENGLPEGLQLSALLQLLGPDTLVVPWAHQNTLLGHPNTKAFVSSAGLHSLAEAAFHGVPMVNLPFQKEQLGNARLAEWRGFGVTCPQALVFSSSKKAPAAEAATAHCNCTMGDANVASAGGGAAATADAAGASSAAESAAAAAVSDRCGDLGREGSGSCAADGVYDAAAGAAADVSSGASPCRGNHSYTAEVLAEYVFKVLDPESGYAAAAARLKHVLQYRASVRPSMQLAADEFEAVLLREGLVQVQQEQQQQHEQPHVQHATVQ